MAAEFNNANYRMTHDIFLYAIYNYDVNGKITDSIRGLSTFYMLLAPMYHDNMSALSLNGFYKSDNVAPSKWCTVVLLRVNRDVSLRNLCELM